MELTHVSDKDSMLDIEEIKLLNKATQQFLESPKLKATSFNIDKGLSIFAKYGICIGESQRLKIIRKIKKNVEKI